jgi:hypothetical protein
MASLITRITTLIATFTVITTLGVPLNDTFSKINGGFKGKGASETPITYYHDIPQEDKHAL